jgi:FixJ family two-component response regulator
MILVVDDDLTFVGFVCAAMEKLGVRTAVAPTGRDAMRHLAQAVPAGILLDLRLPDMDGLDLMRAIRGHNNAVPVAVVTGAASVPAAVEALQLGALDFLEKPVRLAQLSTAVSRLLSEGARQSQRLSTMVTGGTALVDQLVRCMIAVVSHDEDVPTVRAWCLLIGKSKSSLSALCALIGVAPKAALDLARLLRAISVMPSGDVCDALLAADPRTVKALLRRAGSGGERSLNQEDFLASQQLILDGHVIERLTRCLREHRA